MGSKTATRLWQVYKEAGRPWPQLDDDDVIDFMIMESVAVAAARGKQEEEKAVERKNWRKDKAGLDHLRNVAG